MGCFLKTTTGTVPVIGWLASSGAKVDFHFAVDVARVVDCGGGNSGTCRTPVYEPNIPYLPGLRGWKAREVNEADDPQ